MLSGLSAGVRQYALVTGNYWAFTLTDGALRMLVVLHFHQLGYGALEIALLFVFYEFFGMVTNLAGGWLGARFGLNRTMNAGLALQLVALAMLLVPGAWLTVPWVMAAQALSGIAKDLNKMSAKSAIKTLVPAGAQGRLYQWVALLTGSKNALKGAGFFMGGALLMGLGFRGAVLAMVAGLALVWCLSLLRLRGDLGRLGNKPKFTDIFSNSAAVNVLAAARTFLFAARDVWFVVALPVYLSAVLGWNHGQVGGFLALWVIGYGMVQVLAPRLTGREPGRGSVVAAGIALAFIPACMAAALVSGAHPAVVMILGLGLFGLVFALNSAVHSYLIVSYARAEGASLDVGFYYMANAAGRLAGTLLSGVLYQHWGMAVCLWASAALVLLAVGLSVLLPGEGNGERRTQNAERRTQNAERRTQNAERRTQNAERRTQNAERRTQNAWMRAGKWEKFPRGEKKIGVYRSLQSLKNSSLHRLRGRVGVGAVDVGTVCKAKCHAQCLSPEPASNL